MRIDVRPHFLVADCFYHNLDVESSQFASICASRSATSAPFCNSVHARLDAALARPDARPLYLRYMSRVGHAARIVGGRGRAGGPATVCLRGSSAFPLPLSTRCLKLKAHGVEP
jgi:hypothetical protein